ncbi:MAG: DUF3800 domain-containing protein [Anaerocolumna aminovalerica]|uniref:DUF3800 domain-containing protein n=1 Tax=Anaerocolumna aminovalerica TaxID=1527 RepID=UPI0029084D18|nr:DUF3800 domain-containing protein [Anaerocolumna aminovalerica]MDU6263696.1 DUF3800 domain-containing protein [Anaerocolumna aminovalerica]
MNIYIDESGSITAQYCETNPYFIISMVRVLDKDKLKRAYKRFVSKKYDRLKALDINNKMFKNDEFIELKGNQFDRQLKKEFVSFFARNNYFELYIVKVDNSRLLQKFCNNTARAFNYVVQLALQYLYKNEILPDEPCNLQLDERNERPETKYFLENYLNTHLLLDGAAANEFTVQYFDSANNNLIQIADVFANLFYSHYRTNAYKEEIAFLKNNGYLKLTFDFPL